MECVRNHRIKCPGHDSAECCLNCDGVAALTPVLQPLGSYPFRHLPEEVERTARMTK